MVYFYAAFMFVSPYNQVNPTTNTGKQLWHRELLGIPRRPILMEKENIVLSAVGPRWSPLKHEAAVLEIAEEFTFRDKSQSVHTNVQRASPKHDRLQNDFIRIKGRLEDVKQPRSRQEIACTR
jgi:hypothetical protein